MLHCQTLIPITHGKNKKSRMETKKLKYHKQYAKNLNYLINPIFCIRNLGLFRIHHQEA